MPVQARFPLPRPGHARASYAPAIPPPPLHPSGVVTIAPAGPLAAVLTGRSTITGQSVSCGTPPPLVLRPEDPQVITPSM